MAFGKKKKKAQKAQQEQRETVVVTKVAPGENVLYPPKEESVVKETGIALGTVVVVILLVGLIISKKSFSNINNYNNYNHYGNTQSSSNNNQVSQNNNQNNNQEDIPADVPEESGEEETPANVVGDVIIIDRAQRVESSMWSQIAAEDIPEEEEPEETSDYILENSDSRYITGDEISGLDKTELSRARNEIYARHGRKFKDEALQEYFNSKSWYNGTIHPESFTESMLNAYEKANVERIIEMEKSKGYR